MQTLIKDKIRINLEKSLNTGESNNYKNGIYNLEFYIGYDIAMISNIITNEKSKSTAHIDRYFDVSKNRSG